MSLIDKTYFTQEISIPDDKYNTELDLINKYEPEILKKLLGLELYRKVIDLSNVDTEIVAIREGSDYTVNDVLYRWNGLINSEKISLISYYVFYWYVRKKSSETSTIGEVLGSPENSVNYNSAYKMMEAWQNAKYLYGSAEHPTNYESAYSYLTANIDDYPEWHFTEIESLNLFGI